MLTFKVLFIGFETDVIDMYNSNIKSCIKKLQKQYFLITTYEITIVAGLKLTKKRLEKCCYDLIILVVKDDQFNITHDLLNITNKAIYSYKILVTDGFTLSNYKREFQIYLDYSFNEIHKNDNIMFFIENWILRNQDSLSLN